MNEVWNNIWVGIAGGSWLDQVNLVVGIGGVGLMIKRSLWAFPVGLVAVTVQGVLFYRTRFYADATLQIFFFVALAWGWRHWVRDRGAARELPVTVMSWRGRVVTVALAMVATVVWAMALQRWTDAVMPWRDAFIAAFQVAGQVAQARKKLENWPLWILANGVAVVSYWSADLAYTAFLFGVYLVLAVVGWREWAQAMKGAASPSKTVNRAIKRIVVFGTESTGKSSLAQVLAAHFGEPWAPEFVREFWELRGGKIVAEDLGTIALGQIANEDFAVSRARRRVFCDTELLTCTLWNDWLFPGACPAWVRTEAEERARGYALWLLCDTDIPWAPDPQRCFPDEAGRQRGRQLWREALESRGLPFVEIHGDWAARERAAIAAVEALS